MVQKMYVMIRKIMVAFFFSDVASEDRAPTVLHGSDPIIWCGDWVGISIWKDELIGNEKHAIHDISEWSRGAFLLQTQVQATELGW